MQVNMNQTMEKIRDIKIPPAVKPYLTPRNVVGAAAALAVSYGAYRYFAKPKGRKSVNDLIPKHTANAEASSQSLASSSEMNQILSDDEARLDQMAEDTFPASDPPSYSHAIAHVTM